MFIFYLIFLIITLAIGYSLQRRGRIVVARLQTETVNLLTAAAAGFLLLESIVWLYLMLVTIDALAIEFSPGRPKPYFLISWALGIVAYGFLALLRSPFDILVRHRLEK